MESSRSAELYNEEKTDQITAVSEPKPLTICPKYGLSAPKALTVYSLDGHFYLVDKKTERLKELSVNDNSIPSDDIYKKFVNYLGSNMFAESDYILTTAEITAKIIEIIRETTEYCFLITPYIDPCEEVLKWLQTAYNQKKRIVFFFREPKKKDKEDKNDKLKIEDFYNKLNFDIILIKDLHAKIYLNERRALITSMNLTKSAYDPDASEPSKGNQKRSNYEIGVLINDKDKVKKIASEIIIDSIYKTGYVDHKKGKYYDLLKNDLFFEPQINYCVICGCPKPDIPNYKYCRDCYIKRNNELGFNDVPKFCLHCGEERSKAFEKGKYYWCSHCKKQSKKR